jgi:hypothetical protein
MSQSDLQFVSSLLQAFLLAILPVLAVVAVRWVWSVTKTEAAKLDEQTLRTLMMLAGMAVKAAEQAKLSEYIEDKKTYALGFCHDWLALRGIDMDVEAVSAAIEAAVMDEFNREKPKPEPETFKRVDQPRPVKIPANGPFQD